MNPGMVCPSCHDTGLFHDLSSQPGMGSKSVWEGVKELFAGLFYNVYIRLLWEIPKFFWRLLFRKKKPQHIWAYNMACRYCQKFATMCGHCGSTFSLPKPLRHRSKVQCEFCRGVSLIKED